jgi:hypothetical protein
MPQDLNKIMDSIQKDSRELETKMQSLMEKYESFYREGNRQYMQERAAAVSMEGLEDFYLLVQTTRRNRDVIGSLIRGIKGLRDLAKYKFVEETVSVAKAKIKKKKEIKIHAPAPEEEFEPLFPPEMTEPQQGPDKIEPKQGPDKIEPKQG